MAADADGLALTTFQIEVANKFFSLPAAEGFLLCGGAALVAQRLTTRPTQDLDFFADGTADDVGRARNRTFGDNDVSALREFFAEWTAQLRGEISR